MKKKTASNIRKKNEALFSFLIVSDCMVYTEPKFLIFFRIRVNHTIRHNQHNQTQWHKVNDFDFCFVLKCLDISNSRTKPAQIWGRYGGQGGLE